MRKECLPEMTFETFLLFEDIFQHPRQLSETKKSLVLFNAEDYLQRGERITSLAKEHFQKVCKNISLSSAEQMLYGYKFQTVSPSFEQILGAFKKVSRKILRGAKSDSDPILQELMSIIHPSYGVEIKFDALKEEPNKYHSR